MWLVTREAREGQPLVDALKARGHEAVCVPAIRREPLPWPEELDVPAATAATARDAAPLWFLTSAYAAQIVTVRLGDDAVKRARFAAIAPSTSHVLVDAGGRVEVLAEGGALALAEACANAGVRGSVLYPTSDAGLIQAEQTSALAVLSRTCAVRRAAVYTTVPDVHLDDNLRLVAARVRFQVVLFSPSAARAFAASLERTGVAGLARVVTVGASTARTWPAAVAPHAHVVAAPAGVDIVDFLCSLEKP